jgi:ribonuclease HI
VTVGRGHIPRSGGLFGDVPPEHRPAIAAYHANIDGGSRGNPGPAAYGVVIRDPRGDVIARLKKYIGHNTNNVAEYFGLIAALDYAQTHGIHALRVESDSELLVRQLRGQYKVKSEDLRPLHERAKKMAQALESFRIDHVLRERNREADKLVNEVLDETSRLGPASAPSRPAIKENSVRVLARYKDGYLLPREPLDLPDGTEVEILVRVRK